MARIRTLYSNEAALVGQNDAVTGDHGNTDINLLERVQSFDMSLSVPLEDINEFTRLAAIDRINLEGAETSANISYLVVDAINEQSLGMDVSTVGFDLPAFSGILAKAEGRSERNYFKAIADEGTDSNGQAPADVAVIGLGNCYLSSYSVEGSVGGYVTATVALQGSNAAAYTDGSAEPVPSIDTDGSVPAINFTLPTIAPEASTDKPPALKVSEVEANFYTAGSSTYDSPFFAFGSGDFKLQSFNISIDLNREPIREVGAYRPIAREVTFPLTYTVQLEALAGDITADNLTGYLCGATDVDVEFLLNIDDCFAAGVTGTGVQISGVTRRVGLKCKNLSFTSEDLSTSVGPNSTVSLSLEGQIGGANDTGNGLFISGVTAY